MKFEFTGDSDLSTSITEFVCATNFAVEKALKPNRYGEGVESIFLVLMSHPFNARLKKRQRFTKKDRALWSDVFVPYEEVSKAPFDRRPQIIVSAIDAEMNSLQEKYDKLDFDFSQFRSDLLLAFKPFEVDPSLIDWNKEGLKKLEKIQKNDSTQRSKP